MKAGSSSLQDWHVGTSLGVPARVFSHILLDTKLTTVPISARFHPTPGNPCESNSNV